jgi:hypothetical protein
MTKYDLEYEDGAADKKSANEKSHISRLKKKSM